MGKHLEIENIEEMRRQVGIDDVELREAVRRLRVGDYVNLTLLTGTHSAAGKTVRVRITHTEGASFRGRLVGRPPYPGPPGLGAGTRLTFTAAHIHSVPKGQCSHAP